MPIRPAVAGVGILLLKSLTLSGIPSIMQVPRARPCIMPSMKCRWQRLNKVCTPGCRRRRENRAGMGQPSRSMLRRPVAACKPIELADRAAQPKP